MERFDAIVLGAGPGGEVAADRLLKAGLRVAVIERELIGGECAYWACVPSKTLLRAPEAGAAAGRAPGANRPSLDFGEAAAYRDFMIRDLDDGGQVRTYEEQGATVIKAAGRLAGPGQVEAGGRTLAAEHVIVATGSDPKLPPVEGLEEVGAWTNREATTLQQVPERTLVIGGGPVGVELGQMLGRFGSEVVLVQGPDRLLNREDPRVGALLTADLHEDGVDVRLGRRVRRLHRDGGRVSAELDDGTELDVTQVVVGTGRTPRAHDIGLETVGVEPGKRGIAVDDGCRVQDGLWAVGDVTGIAPFTHVAKYQARVVADRILGLDRTADYRSVPRVVFTDPEVAAVGLTAAQARDRGLDVSTASVALPAELARPWTYERDPRGELGLVADRGHGVLVGAWAVAPLAGEWIHLAGLAIRAEVPLSVLEDTVAQFPTYTEGYLKALERLD